MDLILICLPKIFILHCRLPLPTEAFLRTGLVPVPPGYHSLLRPGLLSCIWWNIHRLPPVPPGYHSRGDYNVFAVDARNLSKSPLLCYPYAVRNAPIMGKCLAELVKKLRRLGAEDLHVIGFSLGAHVAGFAANELKPYMLPRITGKPRVFVMGETYIISSLKDEWALPSWWKTFN